jgi:hypothetical protein
VSEPEREPVDLHDLASRVIVPHVEGDRECVLCQRVTKRLKSTRRKALYASRRGACTIVVEVTGGNYAAA